MKINNQQKICDVNYLYKSIPFITEEFVSNKVLWIFEKHKDLLNQVKNWKKINFYKKLENLKIIFWLWSWVFKNLM